MNGGNIVKVVKNQMTYRRSHRVFIKTKGGKAQAIGWEQEPQQPKLNLKSNKEWRQYCKSGKKPVDIPSNPDATYKNQGWINWADWLGKDQV